MKYSKGRPGRVFVVKLELGDILHEEIERLAIKEKIKRAGVILVGGSDKGSRLVVGPAGKKHEPIMPMEIVLNNVYEIAGVGTIFPNSQGKPVLHMHIASGRKKESITGCVRKGVKIWHVGEAVIFEILGSKACRKKDMKTGFDLLEP